jgi:SNF2 family DNA or RNA helicase
MYDKNLNGILADEMGLGKTIQTISLLAYLACEKQVWGPHLIIVPSSVLLNWEMELKRWCPGFKILTYFGTQKQRKLKRVGWTKPNSFHVCLTSYKLITQDQHVFKRKKWHYIILDEAHHIKNFKSQLWQTLLNFSSKRRLLLTGTPLQNDLMELWSLMHFLMPHVFQSHKEFKDWFSNPVNNMIEGSDKVNGDVIQRLHGVLRPFLLRRLKKDVEKQLPQKHEHVIMCRLSKRQRYLYEEFMSRSNTRTTLASGNYLGIANVLMQLRKVCNHPDLFETRPIVSPFDQLQRVRKWAPSLALNALNYKPLDDLNLDHLSLRLIDNEEGSQAQYAATTQLKPKKPKIVEVGANIIKEKKDDYAKEHKVPSVFDSFTKAREDVEMQEIGDRFQIFAAENEQRCHERPMFGEDLIRLVEVKSTTTKTVENSQDPKKYLEYTNTLRNTIVSPEQRSESMNEELTKFLCYIPSARAQSIQMHCSHPDPSEAVKRESAKQSVIDELNPAIELLHTANIRTQIYFPDKRLIQFDCGKLQQLDTLLRRLKSGGHRALIFTQMSKMLDVFEIFLNIHGHTYLRLDGTTKVERRQYLMERFNNDPKIFLFILSTRTGGVGVNLTGADTVIFYDSDWNPAMDQQAQDRCHRIGQTREVNIYRLVSEHTIEENILKKARQKRELDKLVIKQGNFTTDFFKQVDLKDLISDAKASAGVQEDQSIQQINEGDLEKAFTAAEDESDVLALKTAQREQAALDVGEDEFNEAAPVAEEQKEIKFEFENELMPVERYGMRFVETVNPVIDKNALEEAHRELEMEEKQWEEGTKKLMQMNQVSAPDNDDDISPIKYKPRGRKGRPRKSDTNNNNNNNNKKNINNNEDISNSGDPQ